jgi:hypothetical protein
MFRNRPSASINSSTAGAGSGSAATAIQGSIRPPPNDGGSSGGNNPYSRQQHLDSYLMDDTLSKSTRRVSTGAFLFLINMGCCGKGSLATVPSG